MMDNLDSNNLARYLAGEANPEERYWPIVQVNLSIPISSPKSKLE